MMMRTILNILLATLIGGLAPLAAEERPEFVSYLRDNRFVEVSITERVLETHAPWKTDTMREVSRTGYFVNDYTVMAGGIRPDLAVSMTVRLNEESRPIPASIIYFDTELGLALITLAAKTWLEHRYGDELAATRRH